MTGWRSVALGAAGMIELFGAVAHGLTYRAAARDILAAGLSPVRTGELLALWLANSANLAVFGLYALLLAARPTEAARAPSALLALAALASAGLLYRQAGPIAPAHAMLAAGLLLTAAALGRPAVRRAGLT